MKYKQISRQMIILFVIGGIGIVFAGGWLYTEYQKSQAGVAQGILTGIPCAPPCWQHITPGDSIETDAITSLLETLPGVFDYRVRGGMIDWSWQWYRSNIYENSIYLNKQVVGSITLKVDTKLTVEQILDKYGFPEATDITLAGLPEHQYVLVRLFYPLQGVTFAVRLSKQRPLLKPTTQIFEVQYTIPAESLASWKTTVADWLPEHNLWPGYGDLCDELEKNGFVCP